ncbi:MAG: TIGR04283 family arsenosugar biosynthesis glycosyltransferase [Deltaproteobacteria bacterium]|nr:TIGR04283 family arsenosugar biosynthesis glycosyltransferase [Myxococcales bacterium]MCZ6569418.1 TIGR04283 family arsenosugar biosynthesis glycosyltransferase [Deltaproteobacteria bacterium]
MSAAQTLVSIVIPTLNEQMQLERVLTCTREDGVERIVVDGGSSDGTAETAHSLQAERVLLSSPGRALQMDVGYRAASGDVLMFLHADSWLEPGWLACLRTALQDPRVAGGAFALRFASRRWVYRFLELGAWLRARLGGLPYGDQALFVRRALLDAQGGIPLVPIFEDLDLARLIRRNGRMALLSARVRTSPRRYEARGALRTWLRNTVALAAYGLGLDRERVARWYRRGPGR